MPSIGANAFTKRVLFREKAMKTKLHVLPLFLPILLAMLLLGGLTLSARAQDGPPPSGGWRGGEGGGMGGGRGVAGTVTAVSGSTITLKTEDGDSYQVLTSANSHIMKRVDRQPEPVKVADIHVGDAVMAGGEVDAKAKTVGAVFVMVLTPEQAAQAKKMREDFGKTWTAGEVTAIKDLDITIKRRDGVTQTISVDENTSFKKRQDSITLADIQVGDMLRATGALKGSSFVAATINVGRMGGPGGEERGPRGGETPVGAPPSPPQ
jgi:hypothetical protein